MILDSNCVNNYAIPVTNKYVNEIMTAKANAGYQNLNVDSNFEGNYEIPVNNKYVNQDMIAKTYADYLTLY